MSIVLYFFRHEPDFLEPKTIIHDYLSEVLLHLTIIKNVGNRFPEMHNNMTALTEYAATGERPADYNDSSTLLITMVFELLAVIDAEDLYTRYRSTFANKINLQTAHTDVPIEELEPLLFSKHLHDEYYVETNINLPESFADFKHTLREKAPEERTYLSDAAGFDFLRLLAHTYFKNEFFVNEWRQFMA